MELIEHIRVKIKEFIRKNKQNRTNEMQMNLRQLSLRVLLLISLKIIAKVLGLKLILYDFCGQTLSMLPRGTEKLNRNYSKYKDLIHSY